MATLPFSPAADRNKQPILEALRGVLPARGRALEIASGTGQHAAWLGAGLPGWEWQPTEANSTALPTIAAWVRQAGASNVRPPCLLDVMEPQWPSDEETLASAFARPFDAIFCANMLHISPWARHAGEQPAAGVRVSLTPVRAPGGPQPGRNFGPHGPLPSRPSFEAGSACTHRTPSRQPRSHRTAAAGWPLRRSPLACPPGPHAPRHSPRKAS